MAGLIDMALQLGDAMARTDEYQALQRAVSAADEDRDLVTLRNEMSSLEQRVAVAMQSGKEPEEELKDEYESTFMKLQANPSYQRLVAAQSNFDRIVMKVNETISQGMEKGASSRIILPSS